MSSLNATLLVVMVLFSFVLKSSYPKATTALLDGMKHFSMGYSWGGFESLILANEPKSFNSLRTVANPNFEGTLGPPAHRS